MSVCDLTVLIKAEQAQSCVCSSLCCELYANTKSVSAIILAFPEPGRMETSPLAAFSSSLSFVNLWSFLFEWVACETADVCLSFEITCLYIQISICSGFLPLELADLVFRDQVCRFPFAVFQCLIVEAHITPLMKFSWLLELHLLPSSAGNIFKVKI